jgi:hypothetical protein
MSETSRKPRAQSSEGSQPIFSYIGSPKRRPVEQLYNYTKRFEARIV